MVLSRDDGTIELYVLNKMLTSANLVYETRESETITGIDVGFITSSSKKEILYTCYSGAVKSLIDRKSLKKFGTVTEDNTALSV